MSEVTKTEKLEKLLTDLQDTLDDGAVVVVEGPNDERALRVLGIKGRTVQLSKKSFTELAEELAGSFRRVVILTDFDSYGEKAMRGLRDSFSNEGIRADVSFRTRFHKLLGFTEFENVPSLLEKETQK